MAIGGSITAITQAKTLYIPYTMAFIIIFGICIYVRNFNKCFSKSKNKPNKKLEG